MSNREARRTANSLTNNEMRDLRSVPIRVSFGKGLGGQKRRGLYRIPSEIYVKSTNVARID